MQQIEKSITVGFAGGHGLSHEAAADPPEHVEFKNLKALTTHHGPIRSPIKGFMRKFDDEMVDVVEAIISPAITERPWIYSLACYQEPMAFSAWNIPLPKRIRQQFLNRLFLKENFKTLAFWSQAGADTLHTYGNIHNQDLIDKSQVIYPAIREVPDQLVASPDSGLRIMLNSDFFRKGGAHVVDAFLKLHNDYPEAELRLCCDPDIDFNTPNLSLRTEYLDKIAAHPNITLGRVSREEMLETILPNTDIFVLPTYAEAFGFAILEAMAYGIPVIATNIFAIPEIIDDEQTGLLIDVDKYDLESMFRGYVVKEIPQEFHSDMTAKLYSRLHELAESPNTRKQLGEAGRRLVRDKFSFARRNREMLQIYQQAIQ